jgi:1-acyl-sn-glycerol-3-phosphate acyltransferase
VHVPPRPIRLLLLPFLLGILGIWVVVFAVGAVLSALLLPFGARNRPMRVSMFGLSYCLMEFTVVILSGCLWVLDLATRVFRIHDKERWIRWHRTLLKQALNCVIWSAGRCVHFKLLHSKSSVRSLSDQDPTLMLARHGGPGDSFVLVHMLLTKYGRDVRIVLKDVLQWDPALDIVLNRLGCTFLPTHAGPEGMARIASMAEALRAGDVLLLFPEGANWTPHRWRKAIRKLRIRQGAREARDAERMRHVLPPHLGGVTACLDARPDVQVVISAHAGLDRIVSARQLWENLPFGCPMVVKIWGVATPVGDEDRVAWLTGQWRAVDQWIESTYIDENGSAIAI